MPELRLNLGCGPLRLEDEIGVDLYPTPSTDVAADIMCLPFADGVADFVRMDHVLEHLDRAHGFTALREATRVLKAGGTIKIGVPDLVKYCELWAQTGTDMQLKQDILHGLYGAQGHEGDYHKAGYDEAMLRDMLDVLGFKDVKAEPDEAPWRTEGFCLTVEGVKA